MAARRVVTVVVSSVLVLGACTPSGPGATNDPDDLPSASTSEPGATNGTTRDDTQGASLPGTPPSSALPTPIPLPVSPTARLRIGLDRDPSTLDPNRVSDDAGLLVVDAVFDSLTSLSSDLRQVLPAASSSWRVSGDQRVWTFTIRPGKWHDGLPVLAADFVRGFNHAAMPDPDGTPGFNAHLLEHVEGFDATQSDGVGLAGVRALDQSTLQVTLSEPMAEFATVVSDPALAPRRRFPPDPDRPVGNGPFALADPWAHNQFIRVRVADEHWNLPALAEVVFQIYSQEGAARLQLEDFRAGVLDVAQVPATELETVGTEFGVSADGHSGPGLLQGVADEVYYIGFNTQSPPFDDPQVRLGIAQLVDRDAIIEELTGSSRTRATGIVPAALPGADSIDCPACRHDPLNAARLLADLADRLSGPVRILTIEGSTNEQIAQRLATALREVAGVEVVVEAPSLGDWVNRVRAPSLQVFRGGWEASWPTMGGMLEPMFHSGSADSGNLVRLSDPDVDAAIDRASATVGNAIPQWQAVEAVLAQRAVVAPVYWYQVNRVVADDVTGFTLDAAGRVDLTAVEVNRE